MKYANDKNIPFVAMVGERELQEDKLMLKNMASGEQELLSIEGLISALSQR